MYATGQLTADEEAIKWLTIGVEALGLIVDLNTTHSEVKHGFHQRNVEGVVDIEGQVVEELLAKGILNLAVRNSVVVLKCGLESLLSAADLLGKFPARHLLHQATAGVVAGMEVENVGSFRVKDESDGPETLLLLFPHLAGYVIAVAELVAEALALAIKEKTALTTKS
jgi:hypothetical protein